MKLQVLYKYWEKIGYGPETVADSLLEFQKRQLKKTFPLLCHCLKILGTAPVTTCECKRNISAMQILKNYKRTTTNQERFSSLAVLHVHRDYEVDIDSIIDLRRMQFINILCDDE